MTFLLDENFPKSAVTFLESLQHEVFDFRMVGKEGAPDSDVIQKALELAAVILTTDRDFFHTLGRKYPKHHGIVVIALKQPTRDAIVSRLRWFLGHFTDADVTGRCFQLRDQR